MYSAGYYIPYRFSFSLRAWMLSIGVLLLLVANPLFGQPSASAKKRQLQDEMRQLQEEIRQIEEELKTTSAKKKKSLSEVLSLQAKIRSRERLIGNITSQIDNIEEDIATKNGEIEKLEQDLEKAKTDYAGMLRKAYQGRQTHHMLSFLISAKTFNEAVVRYNYLLKTADFRKRQAEQIQVLTSGLQSAVKDLESSREQKTELLDRQEAQKLQMEEEKKNKDQVLKELTEKEKRFKARQQEKQKAIQQLNQKIQRIIEEEIAAARRKAEAAAGKNVPKPEPGDKPKPAEGIIPLTPEEQQLSQSFEGNRGKLPWPVTRGHVITEFGRHEHPSLKGVFTESNGLDIKTVSGAEARVVFDGVVVSTFFMPTTRHCVIVKHGEYFSVYSGLESVSVKSGQKVTTRQTMGKLFTDQEDDLTKVHIEIWQGKTKLNPRNWLAFQ